MEKSINYEDRVERVVGEFVCLFVIPVSGGGSGGGGNDDDDGRLMQTK